MQLPTSDVATQTHVDASVMPARADPLADVYRAVRNQTVALCEPLETEDYVVSSMPDVSPTKWHLAHTTWFFETFVLSRHQPGYRRHNERYAYLFNSYYVQAGERHCRAKRGLVTRPTVAEVLAYRRYVDDAMLELAGSIGGDMEHPAADLLILGLNHEQQHQELLLTDIKHVFWTNPLRPVYKSRAPQAAALTEQRWHEVAEGIYPIGYRGDGFAYDNEGPPHRVFVEPFRISSRLITNGEYLEFVEDNAYHRPELWLSAGFAAVQENGWEAPLYWEHQDDSGWSQFTLAGTYPVDGGARDEPVCHISYYEADAFARWARHRLPTEFEWEIAASDAPVDGHFVDAGYFHPQPVKTSGNPVEQLYGDTWQWTQSAYVAYPNYTPAPGAIGEYNGKWMSDQWVLRGASCATPRSHARLTYRNFFPSGARWQFSGIRVADGAELAR